MNDFDFLKKWVSKYEEVTDWDELYEDNQHILFELDKESKIDTYVKILEEKLNIKYPKELYEFNLIIGCGELYTNIPQEEKKFEYILLSPASICEIYLGGEDDQDEYQEIREEDLRLLKEEGKMNFCQLSEQGFLRIGIEEKNCAIYYRNKIIADSLQGFIEKLMIDREYFIK